MRSRRESFANLAIAGDEGLRLGHASHFATAGTYAIKPEILFHLVGQCLQLRNNISVLGSDVL
jgi:hypothetical protein